MPLCGLESEVWVRVRVRVEEDSVGCGRGTTCVLMREGGMEEE